MSIIIDIVIVAILLIFLIIGIKRGFLLMLLPLLSIVLAIVLGFLLKGPVRSLLDKTSMESGISSSITSLLQKALDENGGETKEAGESAQNEIPDEVTKEEGEAAVKDSGIPKYIADIVKSWAAKNADDVYGEGTDTAAILGAKIASFAMDLIAFLIIAVIVIIILLIVKLIIKNTRQLNIPVLHQLSSVGGAIVGLALGVVILYGVAFVIGLLASCGVLTGFAESMRKSFLGGFLYNHNLIGQLVAMIKAKF